MPNELVLLTGASGQIGFRTLIQALSSGYHVRAAVRSQRKQDLIANASATQPYLKQLSFVHVTDFEKDGAFDDAVQGVSYIIHIASPLSDAGTDVQRDIVQPAIRGTLSILDSASKASSVKRVVITSSSLATWSFAPDPYTASDFQPDPEVPKEPGFFAYAASKKLALNRTRDWVQEKKPGFAVINIMPSFVWGRNENATTRADLAQGSNGMLLKLALGGANIDQGFPNSACHVDDVAEVHVRALDVPDVGPLRNFGVGWSKEKWQWDDIKEIARKHYPEAFEDGTFVSSGSIKSAEMAFDASETEKTLGIEFKSLETAIKDLAGQYLELK
ncbi:putative uncharacterized oxido [Cyphellophora attinorum]|uniref:Uncharacterized oxido n=1 Tax=Cyphellophora attinorum TaxID=1664694 RepID=A0A0N0NIS8_9EURO|nr:putative uncharacterized oxido [Phialophora attinorum]KPI36088.1 putative uncharacterized oxido [Phialophora attinorum]